MSAGATISVEISLVVIVDPQSNSLETREHWMPVAAVRSSSILHCGCNLLQLSSSSDVSVTSFCSCWRSVNSNRLLYRFVASWSRCFSYCTTCYATIDITRVARDVVCPPLTLVFRQTKFGNCLGRDSAYQGTTKHKHAYTMSIRDLRPNISSVGSDGAACSPGPSLKPPLL